MLGVCGRFSEENFAGSASEFLIYACVWPQNVNSIRENNHINTKEKKWSSWNYKRKNGHLETTKGKMVKSIFKLTAKNINQTRFVDVIFKCSEKLNSVHKLGRKHASATLTFARKIFPLVGHILKSFITDIVIKLLEP